MIRKLSHVGIAVSSIAQSAPFYRDVLGLPEEGGEEVADQGVRVAFFRAGDVRIELLEPTSPESPVAKFIEKRGEGLHHLAYEVDDAAAAVEALQRRGVQMIDSSPRPGSHGTLVAFLHPRSSGRVLTEVTQQRGE
jgi:methylmalonyl-CoA/ethylmalonyl-CoA epimerase